MQWSTKRGSVKRGSVGFQPGAEAGWQTAVGSSEAAGQRGEGVCEAGRRRNRPKGKIQLATQYFTFGG